MFSLSGESGSCRFRSSVRALVSIDRVQPSQPTLTLPSFLSRMCSYVVVSPFTPQAAYIAVSALVIFRRCSWRDELLDAGVKNKGITTRPPHAVLKVMGPPARPRRVPSLPSPRLEARVGAASPFQVLTGFVGPPQVGVGRSRRYSGVLAAVVNDELLYGYEGSAQVAAIV